MPGDLRHLFKNGGNEATESQESNELSRDQKLALFNAKHGSVEEYTKKITDQAEEMGNKVLKLINQELGELVKAQGEKYDPMFIPYVLASAGREFLSQMLVDQYGPMDGMVIGMKAMAEAQMLSEALPNVTPSDQIDAVLAGTALTWVRSIDFIVNGAIHRLSCDCDNCKRSRGELPPLSDED